MSGRAPGKELVQCPVCSTSIPLDLMNSHLDSCFSRQAQQGKASAGQATAGGRSAGGHRQSAQTAPGRPSAGGGGGGGPAHQQPQQPVAPPVALQARPKPSGPRAEVPPNLVFYVMKDKELKGKLQQQGLPVDGSRQVGWCSVALVCSCMVRRRGVCV